MMNEVCVVTMQKQNRTVCWHRTPFFCSLEPKRKTRGEAVGAGRERWEKLVAGWSVNTSPSSREKGRLRLPNALEPRGEAEAPADPSEMPP